MIPAAIWIVGSFTLFVPAWIHTTWKTECIKHIDRFNCKQEMKVKKYNYLWVYTIKCTIFDSPQNVFNFVSRDPKVQAVKGFIQLNPHRAILKVVNNWISYEYNVRFSLFSLHDMAIVLKGIEWLITIKTHTKLQWNITTKKIYKDYDSLIRKETRDERGDELATFN